MTCHVLGHAQPCNASLCAGIEREHEAVRAPLLARIAELESHRRQWRRKAQDAQDEVTRLRTVILTGGAMYRAERSTLGVPGGFEPFDTEAP